MMGLSRELAAKHWVADLTPDQEHLGDFMGQILNELDFNHMY